MKINAPCKYSWTDLSAFGLEKFGSKWPACSAYYFEAGKRWGVNPLLLAFWGAVRSKSFTSKEYCQNIDIYALGGRYASYSDALSVGASELAKFDDTNMLQEQKEVEKLYAEFENYFNKLPPVVEPPKPPKPPVPTKLPPKEVEPEKSKPSAPMNWKKIAAWVSGICTALGVVAVLTPTPLDDIVIKAIKVIADLFSNS